MLISMIGATEVESRLAHIVLIKMFSRLFLANRNLTDYEFVPLVYIHILSICYDSLLVFVLSLSIYHDRSGVCGLCFL